MLVQPHAGGERLAGGGKRRPTRHLDRGHRQRAALRRPRLVGLPVAPAPHDGNLGGFANRHLDGRLAAAAESGAGAAQRDRARRRTVVPDRVRGDDSSFFRAVWGSGPNDVWAAGLGNNVAHFDGQRWTKLNIATNTFTVAGTTIDGSGPDDVWIGDTQGLYRFDGTTWTQVPEFAFQLVFAVAVRARNDVWASVTTGGTNTIYHWDGTAWTPTHTRSNDAGMITDIDARTANDAWAVGTRPADDLPNNLAGVLLHWDGATWIAASEAPVGVRAVLSLPGSHIAVGDAGHVFELSTGAVPAVRDLNPSVVPRLQGIWGSSPSEMWAVGSSGTALHYDGTAIREEATGVTSLLLDVWGTGPDDIWAVGESGVALRRSPPIAGSPVWTPVVTGTTTTLRAVFTAARDDVWIGGDGGLFHSDGVLVSPAVVPGLSATGDRERHPRPRPRRHLGGG